MSNGGDNTVKFPNSPLPGVKRQTFTPESPLDPPTPPLGETSSTAWIEKQFPLHGTPSAPFEPPPSTAEALPSKPSGQEPPNEWNPFDGTLPPPVTTRDAPQRPLGGPGNYIFAVGCPGSGKSTFQSHLFRYLATCGDYQVEPDVEFVRSGASFHKLRAEWQKKWQSGAFPDASDVKQVTEFRYNITPNNGHPAIPFGFLEISGEEFNKLVREGDKPGTLLPSIDQFLNNPKINICFLFVCQGQDWKGDDFLFSQFLEYLAVNIDRNLKAQCSAVLILADPESCQRRLAKLLNIPDDGRPLDIDGFIERFTPLTAALLTGWKHRATIATFSVGRLKDRTVDGKIVRYIAEPSFEDTRFIFNWIYTQFTGRGIGPNFVEKVLGFIRSLGGRS